MGGLEISRAPSFWMGRKNKFRPDAPSGFGPCFPTPESVVSQVLLVDDSPIQLQIRETILRNAGFRVAIATSAESALALLRTASQHVGMVVTDHIMPGTSGDEFVRRLRAANSTVPVLVLSGLPDAEQEYEGLNVTFRLKPLPPPELINLVRQRLKSAA
jgi:DNA-binding response OmpR family regulator